MIFLHTYISDTILYKVTAALDSHKTVILTIYYFIAPALLDQN